MTSEQRENLQRSIECAEHALDQIDRIDWKVDGIRGASKVLSKTRTIRGKLLDLLYDLAKLEEDGNA